MNAPTETQRAIVLMWPQLRGCDRGWTFPTKTHARAVIRRLSTCREHRGSHHFAVVGEGRRIAMSESGQDCIRKAGLLE